MVCHRRFHLAWTVLFGLSCINSINLRADDNLAQPGSDVAFRSRLDGTEQRYVVLLPKDFRADGRYSLMIALHGHGADRWQFVNDKRDECRAARDAAGQHGMIYVSPDYRAKTSWMGPAAEADLLQMLDDLHGQYRLDRVFICGGSMGGTSALAFAAMHPQHVDGVISMNGTANLVEYAGFQQEIQASYGGSKTAQPEVYRQRSAEFFPDRLTMPIGMTAGGQDTLVPADSILRLAELLKLRKSPVQLIHRADGGHQTNYADAMAAFQYVIGQSTASLDSPKPVLAFRDQPRTIVCLGDSVTGVYYHTGGLRAYPEMLELALHKLFPGASINVINAGISGNTTQNGLDRFEADVLSKNPDLITISFGLNDMARIAPDQFRTNLESLVNRSRQRHSQVVLCTPNAVIDTTSRPVEKLIEYCDIIRSVGRQMSVPVCDQFVAGSRLKIRAPWTWRLTLSDEIHPNMDGHKRMAEELCRTITGQSVSIASIGPPQPRLPHVKSLIKDHKPVVVLAMRPFDTLVADAIKQIDDTAVVKVMTWDDTTGKSAQALEQDAKSLVRKMKPDLVVLAIPRAADADTDEQFVRSYTWILNWSLSFGHQEWDCVVVHPAVAAPNVEGRRDQLIRRLVWAQHLDLIDRDSRDPSEAQAIFKNWFAGAGSE